MTIAPDRLNPQALTLEEAQSQIRLAVKDAAFKGLNKSTLDKEIRGIILRALGAISIPSLKQAAYRSLVQFYNTQRRIAEQMMLNARLLLFLALTKLKERADNTPEGEKSPYTKHISLREARTVIIDSPIYSAEEKEDILTYGIALRKYHRDYIRDNIKPWVDRMAEAEALDPDAEGYFEKRSTLRNRAEREVRYQWHEDRLKEFKNKGVKLVICSSHADCSERCRDWQGRVYSLDGTYGVTDDGRKYVPLEDATDIFVSTKRGGVWKNGLFGFNCRHYLVEYKTGYQFPETSEATELRQYEITRQQRAMERHVRKWRIEAEMSKGVDRERYLVARSKAKYWYEQYKGFSKRNGRAYNPSRVQVL